MIESITAVTTDRALYAIYNNHKRDESGIKARLKQRADWLKKYQKNGSCKQKLIKCGVLTSES